MRRFVILLLSILPFLTFAQNQEWIISGKVTDAETGEPVAFATVLLRGTVQGVNTDLDGNYRMRLRQKTDSLSVKVVGYARLSKAIPYGKDRNITLNFSLKSSSALIKEIVIKAGENPAFRILRGVWANSFKNNKKSLKTYTYEAYSKAEVSMDKISEGLKDKRLMRPVTKAFDSLKYQPDGEDRPRLPIFYSENLSDCYYDAEYGRNKEVIKAAMVDGVGVEDGSFVTQILGNSYRDYNFYENWVQILDKQFISPLADGGRLYYEYYLVDSFFQNSHKFYKVKMKPKREKDLAFRGYMIIQDTIFALKKMVAETTKESNINYVDRLRIEQELEPTELGPWLPSHVKLFIDFGDITEILFGAVAQFDVSMRKFNTGKRMPLEFYDKLVVVNEDAMDKDEKYWEANRHTPQMGAEKNIYQVVNDIRNYPTIKGFAEVLKVLATGFYRSGNIDYGPWLFLYGNNPTEGARFRMGIRTNHFFSKKWIFSAYGAYGLNDDRFKHFVQAEYFLNRKRWTRIGYQHKYDVEAIGIDQSYLADNKVASVSTQAFAAAAQLGALSRLNYSQVNKLWFESDIARNLNIRTSFTHKDLDPTGFVFAYYDRPRDSTSSIRSAYSTTEATVDLRYAPGEELLINGNDRGIIRRNYRPVYTLSFTKGFKDVLGGSFNYRKLTFNVSKNFRMGVLGWGEYSLTASRVFDPLPYLLLEVQPGNETFLKFKNVFNMMNFFELVSDRSVTIRGIQHFEGLFVNAIPLIRKLDLRLVAGGAICFGGYNERSREHMPNFDAQGRKVSEFYTLNERKPYAEVSYGFENVFKILRVEAFHRLTYLDIPDAPRFRIKVSAAFTF